MEKLLVVSKILFDNDIIDKNNEIIILRQNIEEYASLLALALCDGGHQRGVLYHETLVKCVLCGDYIKLPKDKPEKICTKCLIFQNKFEKEWKKKHGYYQ